MSDAAGSTAPAVAATGTPAPAPAAQPATPAQAETVSTPAAATVTAATPPAASPAAAATEAPKSILEGGLGDPAATPSAAVPVPSPAMDMFKDVKAPEGVSLDTPTWQAVAPVLAEAGLKPEQAQKLIDAYGKAEVARAAEQKKQLDAIQADNIAECRKQFKAEDIAAAQRAQRAFLNDPFLQEVFKGPLGNHPALISGLARIGRAIADDGTPMPPGGGAAPVKQGLGAMLLASQQTTG